VRREHGDLFGAPAVGRDANGVDAGDSEAVGCGGPQSLDDAALLDSEEGVGPLDVARHFEVDLVAEDVGVAVEVGRLPHQVDL